MRTILFGYKEKDNFWAIRRMIGVFPLLLALTGLVFSIPAQESGWKKSLNKCWVFEYESTPFPSLASDNEQLFLSLVSGSIVSLNQDDGSIGWRADYGGNFGAELFSNGDRLYVRARFGPENEKAATSSLLRAINNKTSVPAWQASFDGDSKLLRKDSAGEFLLVVEGDGSLTKVASSGNRIWTRNYGPALTSNVAVRDTELIFGSEDRTLLFVDSETGKLLRQLNVKGVPDAVAATSEGFFVGDQEGGLYHLRGDSTEPVWTTNTGAGIQEIYVRQRTLIVSSKDNFVYGVRISDGKKTWKRKLSGRSLGMAEIDGRHAVFLSTGSSTAVVLDLTDGSLVNKLDLGEAFLTGPVKTKHGFAVATETKVVSVSKNKCGKQ